VNEGWVCVTYIPRGWVRSSFFADSHNSYSISKRVETTDVWCDCNHTLLPWLQRCEITVRPVFTFTMRRRWDGSIVSIRERIFPLQTMEGTCIWSSVPGAGDPPPPEHPCGLPARKAEFTCEGCNNHRYQQCRDQIEGSPDVQCQNALRAAETFCCAGIEDSQWRAQRDCINGFYDFLENVP